MVQTSEVRVWHDAANGLTSCLFRKSYPHVLMMQSGQDGDGDGHAVVGMIAEKGVCCPCRKLTL